MKREGIIFVISAPSGAGKTTLCKELIDFFPDLRQSVSFTTRAMRPAEKAGRDYHFISASSFAMMVDKGEFAEWAEVHGHYYGTALATLDACRQNGCDVLLDIDFQGAEQLRRNYNRAVFIFIVPPDMAELERRLRLRGTESDEVINHRLENARSELQAGDWYDYLVTNDDFDSALSKLKAIVIAEACKRSRISFSVAELVGLSV